jgi:citrate lyase subunit beta-like protein
LYVPGNDERKIKKVTSLDVDCVVLDCEDGVAMNQKVINIHDLLLAL